MVEFGNDLAERGDSIAQSRQLATNGEHDRLGKTQGPGHDAIPQQNRMQARHGGFVQAQKSAKLPAFTVLRALNRHRDPRKAN